MIELDDGRVLRKGFIGDPSWIDLNRRTVAAVDRAIGREYARELRALRLRLSIPAWVPIDLREDYIDLAATKGEEEAASIVRALKRDMAVRA